MIELAERARFVAEPLDVARVVGRDHLERDRLTGALVERAPDLAHTAARHEALDREPAVDHNTRAQRCAQRISRALSPSRD
jgi:hypothetical protein